MDVDPTIKALCDAVTAKRPRTVIEHILKHGHVTTEELQTLYGYDHPPRAARDVRENGVPLETFWVPSGRNGRKIGAYRFADPSKIKRGRIGGRKAFSKAFKEALVERYGEADAITGEAVDSRYLQIDHRVPYEVAGDGNHSEQDPNAYMLLDASSQRAKSWSCEHCRNWREIHDPAICGGCYWAFPESYSHVAMQQVRRTDVDWRGDAECSAFDQLRVQADRAGLSVNDLLKRIVADWLKG